jgi:nucleoprotein TPR
LENHHSSLRSELDKLRERNQQMSDNRAKVEVSLSTATQELFSLQERLTKAELSVQNLRTERDLLRSGEQQARSQYEELLREQRGQNVLLTNLQAIQNNLERGEFETRTRLGSQIEALERELALQKERLQSEEDRRTRVTEAYETQVCYAYWLSRIVTIMVYTCMYGIRKK